MFPILIHSCVFFFLVFFFCFLACLITSGSLPNCSRDELIHRQWRGAMSKKEYTISAYLYLGHIAFQTYIRLMLFWLWHFLRFMFTGLAVASSLHWWMMGGELLTVGPFFGFGCLVVLTCLESSTQPHHSFTRWNQWIPFIFYQAEPERTLARAPDPSNEDRGPEETKKQPRRTQHKPRLPRVV